MKNTNNILKYIYMSTTLAFSAVASGLHELDVPKATSVSSSSEAKAPEDPTAKGKERSWEGPFSEMECKPSSRTISYVEKVKSWLESKEPTQRQTEAKLPISLAPILPTDANPSASSSSSASAEPTPKSSFSVNSSKTADFLVSYELSDEDRAKLLESVMQVFLQQGSIDYLVHPTAKGFHKILEFIQRPEQDAVATFSAFFTLEDEQNAVMVNPDGVFAGRTEKTNPSRNNSLYNHHVRFIFDTRGIAQNVILYQLDDRVYLISLCVPHNVTFEGDDVFGYFPDRVYTDEELQTLMRDTMRQTMHRFQNIGHDFKTVKVFRLISKDFTSI